MIEYDKFQKSLKHLEVQYQHYTTMDENLPEWIKEAIPESIVQRFETCFDSMWKVLKRYLSDEVGVADLPNGPKPILRIANENQLFSSSVEQWIIYLDARNNTAHDYSEEKALNTLAIVENFIDDAIGLYQTMSGKTWE
ncbi:MAG: nucleotidyltransferase substrate binding protein [Thiotrichaceae bacterium]|nr:nucleotidyltransferase substrate binding protein [Thiotrichaceae bacterium]PCI14062.1 MAG: nucleotidyltransferase [Thiotrichales bacterium]